MNSSPLLDSSSAPAPASLLPQLSTTLKEGENCAPFGEVLEQATAEVEAAVAAPEEGNSHQQIAVAKIDAEIEGDVQLEGDFPALPVEEEIKDEEAPANVIPFICVCPPPDEIPVPVGVAPEAVSAPAVEKPVAEKAQPVPTSVEVPTELIEAAEAAAPVVVERPSGRRANRAEAAQKGETEKGVKLDPEIFKPVSVDPPKNELDESVEAPAIQVLKGPEILHKAPPPTTHGTLVAQQVKAMKNGDKTAEISPELVQKMPVREVFRRVAPETSRYEMAALQADFSSATKPEFQFEVRPEVTAPKTIDTVQLVESIRTEVTQLRQRGESTLSVSLRPDNGTELRIEISIARDGSIQAQARCERGDFQNLNGQWAQLQQTLAVHGIRMGDLSNPGDQQHRQDSAHHQSQQNFERGNSQQQNREGRPQRSFEDELAGPAPHFNNNKPFQKSAATTRRWQSWA